MRHDHAAIGPGPARRTVLALSLVALLEAGTAAAADPCVERREELRAGGVVYVEREPTGGKGVALTACGVVEAPPVEVWPVLRDCEHYQEFLPGVERSALLGRAGGVALCEALIDLPFPLGDLRSVERVVEEELPGGGFERRWTLERGDYRRLVGSWRLLPWDAGRRTLAVYELDMDPDSALPDFLLRQAQSATAPRVFAAMRERVRRLRR